MREVAALVKEEDQTAGTGGLGFRPFTSHITAIPTGEPFHGPLSIGIVGRAHWPVRAELP